MRDHSECAEEIARLMGEQKYGEAEYAETRCRRQHVQTQEDA